MILTLSDVCVLYIFFHHGIFLVTCQKTFSPAFSNTNIQGHQQGRASFQYDWWTQGWTRIAISRKNEERFSIRSTQFQALIFSSISPATSGLVRSFPARYSFMTSSIFSDTTGVIYASPQQLHTRAGTFLMTTNSSPAFNTRSVEPSRSLLLQRAALSS